MNKTPINTNERQTIKIIIYSIILLGGLLLAILAIGIYYLKDSQYADYFKLSPETKEQKIEHPYDTIETYSSSFHATPYVNYNQVIVSPDNKHIAYPLSTKDNKTIVIADGIMSPYIFNSVSMLTYSSNSERFAYLGYTDEKTHVIIDHKSEASTSIKNGYINGSNIIFSPDGQKTSYILEVDNNHILYLNGERYSDPTCCIANTSPIFSPDSEKIAYVAKINENPDKWAMNIDGKDLNFGATQIGEISEESKVKIFSPDSQHTAYIGINEDKQFVIKDQNKLEDHNGVKHLFFSPDSQHFAYTALDNQKWRIILDGEKHIQYYGITGESAGFSPNSDRFAYEVFTDKNLESMKLIIDGKESKEYEAVTFSTFSPNSNHIAYTAMQNNQWFVVRDGKKIGAKYDDIAEPFSFSPDSKELAFIGVKNNKYVVVLNGKEITPYYDKIEDLTWSPNSKKLAYKITNDNKMFIGMNGKIDENYIFIGKITFSLDSKYIGYVFRDRKGYSIKINGKENPRRYNKIITHKENEILFDEDNTIHFFIKEDNDLLKVRISP